MAETVTMEAPVALVFSETEMFARFHRPSTEFAVSVAKLSVVLSCNKLQQIVKEGIITVWMKPAYPVKTSRSNE